MAYSSKIGLRTPPKKNGKCSAYLRITIDRKIKVISLNKEIHPEHWNENLENVRKSAPNYEQLRKFFLKTKNKAESIFLSLEDKSLGITIDNFMNYYNGKEEIDFIKFTEEEFKIVGKTLKYGTWRNHNSRFKILKQFSPTLPFDQLDKFFLEKYKNWLIEERNNEPNSANDKLKFVRIYVNRAIDKELMVKNPFRNFKLSYIQPARQTLTPNEIKILDDLLLSNQLDPRLHNVLHYFLIAAYTGLRHSDYGQFNNYKGQDEIELRPNKTLTTTGKTIKIPIPQRAKELLSQKFSIKSLDKTNLYLKEIMKIAGIDKNITTHVARHTFATQLLGMGCDVKTVQEFLGHNDYRSTLIYTHVRPEKMRDVANNFRYH